ncbi:MAG: zinc ribbon domain-containing protein [Halolamina sp.]
MTKYEYACVDCGQQLVVDGRTREAILTNGCPTCAAAAQAEYFAPQRR